MLDRSDVTLAPATAMPAVAIPRSSTVRRSIQVTPMPGAGLTGWRALLSRPIAAIADTVASRLDQLHRLIPCVPPSASVGTTLPERRAVLVGWLWRCHQYGLIDAVERDTLTASLRAVTGAPSV